MKYIFLLTLTVFVASSNGFVHSQENLIEKADALFEKKDYKSAAALYLENAKLLEKKGYKENWNLFNAAIAYKNAKEYDSSNSLLFEILNSDVSESTKIYYAKDKNGNQILIDEKEYLELEKNWDSKKKTDLEPFSIAQINFNKEKVYESLIFNHFKQGKDEKTLEIVNQALEVYPKSRFFPKYKDAIEDVIEKKKDMKLSIEELVAKYPENGQYAYLLSLKKIEDAEQKALLEKAINNKVETSEPYIQLIRKYLNEDEIVRDEINNNLTGTFSNQNKNYNGLVAKRLDLYKLKIIPLVDEGLAKFPEDKKLIEIKERITTFLNSKDK